MKTKHLLVAMLVLAATAMYAQTARTLPQGTVVKVRTDTAIPAKPDANTQYTATVSEDVTDSSGTVVIPRGTRAHLVAVPSDDGKDTNLDLNSVTLNGRRYLLTTQDTANKSSTPGDLGMNKRTGKYVGGGAAVGAVLGALLGGGRGAAIGAILGGAGGAGAQVYTKNHQEIPAETELTYTLAQNLKMQPAESNGSNGDLQTRPAQ